MRLAGFMNEPCTVAVFIIYMDDLRAPETQKVINEYLLNIFTLIPFS